jgi:serine/threonine-protein kinase
LSPGEKETTAEIKRICLACGQTFTDVTRCPKDGNPLVMIKRKDSMIGQVLGGCYEVQALLGRGGMSTVYKGRHTMMNRLVALKVLSSHDPYSLKRFHMEAQLAASLSHANIITVYDFGLAKDGEAFLAMDYIAGKTLAETVASGGPMDYKRAIPMFEQACDALAYAHNKGVIHRDLKPSNFLIASGHAGEDVIKLLDFGIAKQLEPGENYKTLTATGQVFGSPLYMSPEQCMGLKLDPRADVYSLGCVMYEVLTGRPPFIGKTPLDTMQMHVHEDAKPPSRAESLPVMPERLEEIILKAVERDIEHRYQSITELWNDLKELEKDPGRLANSELDTAQIFVDKKEKEQQTAYADTDPNSVSMQQLQLMTPKLDNLAKDFQQGSLFDTRLNDEIDQRIKSGLAVETDEDDEPPVVALDVTRQTIALLNELQKSSVDTGSQLLADRSDRATSGGMQAVAAPPAKAGETAKPEETLGAAAAEPNETAQPEEIAEKEETAGARRPKEIGEASASAGTVDTLEANEVSRSGETADSGDSDSHQFRRPRAFNGPVFPGSVNLSPLQGSIKLGTAATNQSAAGPQAEPASPNPDQSVLDTGDLPPVTEVAPTKQFPSTMPSPVISELPTVTAAAAGPALEPAPAKALPLPPNPESTAPPMVLSSEPQAAPVSSASPVITPAFSLAAVQAKTGDFLARIPEHMASAPAPYIIAFIIIALLTFAYAVCAVHRP